MGTMEREQLNQENNSENKKITDEMLQKEEKEICENLEGRHTTIEEYLIYHIINPKTIPSGKEEIYKKILENKFKKSNTNDIITLIIKATNIS